MYNNFEKYGIVVGTTRTFGNIKVHCPQCHQNRNNKADRSLSVNLATGMFHCHYCGWSGCAQEKDEFDKQLERREYFNSHPMRNQKKDYKKPAPRPESPYSQKLIGYMKGRGISEATMKAMRITEGAEFMPQDNKQMNTVQFNYYKDGELVNTKFRTGSKHFKLVSGAELLPYNLDAIKGQKECIITEGEMDALSFYEIGFHNVVSVPNGANANLEYLDDYIESHFEDKETIYVASDADAKGVILRDELLRRFGYERCKVVEYPDGCKDANEVLQKNGAESLRNALLGSKEVQVEGIFSVSSFEPSLDALFEFGMQKGVIIGHENFDKLCSFETKRLAIVTGIPGSGKSEFLDEIAERLNINYGWKFAYFSPENAPLAYHASKLIEKFVGCKFGKDIMKKSEYEMAKKHLNENFFFISPSENFRLDTILEKAKFLVRRRGIKSLIIDPYNRLETEMSKGQNETQYVSMVLDKLTNFAQINDVLIFLMAHPTKMHKDSTGQIEVPTLYDISGSANFFNKADFGLVVHRNRMEDYTEIHVDKVKFRHLGECGVARFKYNINNGRYADFDPAFPASTEYDNTNHLLQSIQERAINAQTAITPNNDFDNNSDNDDLVFDNGEVPF